MTTSDDVTQIKPDSERISRLEQAVAEITLWVKGNWHGNVAMQSSAGQILDERRNAERVAAEREEAMV